MKYLYVDNYRGFSSTYIPLYDVNFLVGENSTGKSSILSLINLIGSPDFWFDQDFNNDEIELGGFKDIISANSMNKNSFSIGVLEWDEEADFPTKRQNLFLLTFVKEKGSPIIKEYNYVMLDKKVEIIFTKKQIKYKISEIVSKEDLSATLSSVFKSWLNKMNHNGRGFKVIDREKVNLLHKSVLPVIRTLLQYFETSEANEEPDLKGLVRVDIPTFANLTWMAPVRTKPERIYKGYKRTYTPEGNHTPHVIKDLLSHDKMSKNFTKFAQEFGSESGLFEGIYTKNFGQTITSPFELGVYLAGNQLRVSDIGYGVSQSLPIMVELFARNEGQWFAFQQPEVHLHPKAQAALGGLFLKQALEDGKRFLIETHSDYLIDRFRTDYRGNEAAKAIQSQVLFFERSECGNKVHSIPILEDGNYSHNQPTSFREFFIHEEMRILGL